MDLPAGRRKEEWRVNQTQWGFSSIEQGHKIQQIPTTKDIWRRRENQK